MKRNSYRNPFSGTNAVTLDDQAILDYWCSPFTYRLFSKIKERDIYDDPNNIVFEGGRSTGKTMFLRYWSFPVQLKLARESKRSEGKRILDYFNEKGGLGYYLRIDGPILRSFDGFDISAEKWNSIFIHYFELLVARSYIESIKAINDEGEFDRNEISRNFIPKISTLLGANTFSTLEDLLGVLDELIREVDVYRGNIPFYNNEFKPNRGFPSQLLSFGIPRIAKATLHKFKEGIKFVLLVDEYENYLPHQQRVINTLLRFTTSDVKLRLGMRFEGFRTTSMISEDDFIKEDREYRKVVFEELLIKDKDYRDFLEEISRKRLEGVSVLKERGMTNIVTVLSDTENLEEEARALVRKNPEKHINFFRKRLSGEALTLIRYKPNPLLELLNIFWVLRGTSAEETREVMQKYLNGEMSDHRVKKYRMDYVDKYKLSLMFILCSIYRKSKKYYSFNTFCFLSSGIIGHFILLCREAFGYAEFEDDGGLLGAGKVTADQQTKAAIEVSKSELEQLHRIQEHGSRIRRFVDNLGNIFKDFHQDERMRYPETNQFATKLNTITDEVCKSAFRNAIKWSAIQKKPRLQQPAPGKHLGDIYTINRIFCPTFQISYRTRGGYSVALLPEDVVLLMNNDNVSSREFIPKIRDVNSRDKGNLELFDSL